MEWCHIHRCEFHQEIDVALVWLMVGKLGIGYERKGPVSKFIKRGVRQFFLELASQKIALKPFSSVKLDEYPAALLRKIKLHNM